MTLYEMTEQAKYLYELLQAEEIDEAVVNDTLEAIGAGEKVEDYCKLIKQFQYDAEMFGAEINRMKARKKAAENAVERMRTVLVMFLQASGQDKVKAGTFSVSTATTQAVQITDENAIPCRFLVEQPPKIDKAGIKEALKDGETVAGAELVNNTGVRIR